MEFTLLFAALTGFGFAWAAVRILQRGRRIPAELDRPFDILLGAGVVGLFSGRLAAMLIDGVNPLANPADILLVRGGVDTGVASLAALATVVWYTRDDPIPALDALAPAALAGLAGWQVGCVWRGACLGTVSDLPWAWAQPGSDITRHPTELYVAVGLLVVAVAVTRLRPRPGVASGAALAGAAALRWITEPLRPSLDAGPVAWYVTGILVGLALTVLGPRIERVSATPGPG